MDKRFTIEIVDNPFNDNGLSDVILDNGRVIPLNSVVDLLNELDSENTELKKVLQYETQMHNKWKTECTNEIKENNKIKNTIKEMYNNERTYIGKSTLKQLLEQIQ